MVYAIFFGTKSLRGSDRIKEAIWRVDPLGGFEFRGSRGGQGTLRLESADVRPLIAVLQQQFRSRGLVETREVEDFVASDQTDYYTAQLRVNALNPLEDAGEIDIEPAPGKKRRRHTFPPGTKLRFK